MVRTGTRTGERRPTPGRRSLPGISSLLFALSVTERIARKSATLWSASVARPAGVVRKPVGVRVSPAAPLQDSKGFRLAEVPFFFMKTGRAAQKGLAGFMVAFRLLLPLSQFFG